MDEPFDTEALYDEQELEVETEDEAPELEYDENTPNIVTVLAQSEAGKRTLRKIAMFCGECFDSAWSSTAEYRMRVAQDWKLFAGYLPEKTFPFKHCANGNIPVFIENCLRILARMETEIYGDYTSVVGVVPVNEADQDDAEAMSKHDNWQLREEILSFPRQSLRLLQSFTIMGDVTSHSYYDQRRRTNEHETLTPDEFVVPYALVSVMPDYSDVPYYCKIRYMYRHQLEAERENWENVDEILMKSTASWDEEPEAEIRSALGDVQGESVPDDVTGNTTAPYKMIQFEGWVPPDLLPGQTKSRFCQCIFCPQTQRIALLQIHEEVSWRDRAHQRQMQAELDAYHAQREAVEQERERQLSELSTSIETALDENATAEMQRAALPPTPIDLPDPVAPSWVDDLEDVPRNAPSMPKSPILMFSHGVNIEPMLGGLGLGYGKIQADFTRAINTLLNQGIDASTMANAPPMFTSFDLPKDLGWRPGKFTRVHTLGEEIAKGFYKPDIQGANPQMFQVVEMLMSASQASAQAPDVLSGAPGKSGETFRGISSRIEQATKQLSSMGRKFATGVLTQVMRNNARLNSIYLDETQMKSILNPLTKMYETLEIRRDMWDRDYKVEIRADLRFTSEAQRQQEAMELVQLPQAVPALQANMAFQYETLKKFLIAKKMPEAVALLGAPPAPPPEFGALPAPPIGDGTTPGPGAPPPGAAGVPAPPAEGVPQ